MKTSVALAKRTVVGAIVVGAIAVSSCLPAKETTSGLSVSDYATWCGSAVERHERNLKEAGEMTWETYTTLMNIYVEKAKSVVPPQSLEEFHANARVAPAVLTYEFAKKQPPEETLDTLKLFGTLLMAGVLVQEAEDALTPELHELLTDAKCI